jgi:hypothetical protein
VVLLAVDGLIFFRPDAHTQVALLALAERHIRDKCNSHICLDSNSTDLFFGEKKKKKKKKKKKRERKKIPGLVQMCLLFVVAGTEGAEPQRSHVPSRHMQRMGV